jgi:hypothetical protein
MTPEVDALETVAKINDELISTNALLRDENKRWKESHKALRAENAKLQAEIDAVKYLNANLNVQDYQHRTENAKLRAALRNIADPNTDYEAGIEIARAALQKDGGMTDLVDTTPDAPLSQGEELVRARKIISELKLWREAWLTRPHKSTPEMRARIRELATGRDDFDRAVIILLDDFEAEEKARAQNA